MKKGDIKALLTHGPFGVAATSTAGLNGAPAPEELADEATWLSRIAVELGAFLTVILLCVFYLPVVLAIFLGGALQRLAARHV
jgi:hypothetical protein